MALWPQVSVDTEKEIDMCFACGPNNPIGLRIAFTLKNKICRGQFVGTEVEVRRLRCLANCTRGPSAAMRCNGSWTYVFGGLDAANADALVAGAKLLADASDGILPWRGRPEILKRTLIARVPPFDFVESDL